MQYLGLRAISLILVLALITFACDMSKTQIPDVVDKRVSAETVPEGILITLNNIPEDTARLFIGTHHRISDDEPVSSHNFVNSYSDITGDSLEQVKQTGKVILPIAQTGKEYTINVIFQNEKYEDIPDWAYAECVAGNGTYFDNDILFTLNDNNSTLALSSEPIFSSKVTFAPHKYSFAVVVGIESGSLGVGEHHYPEGLSPDGYSWRFEPYLTEAIIEGDYLKPGSYPAFGIAYCNIVYDNIKWVIEIAKTTEFTYSL
jgi:hypothetical protein